MNKGKIIAITGIIVSLLIPLISLAQTSGTQVGSQVLSANSYTFSVPTNAVTFPTTFVDPGDETDFQQVWTPSTEDEIVEFIDLRGNGNFTVTATLTDFTDRGTSESFSFTNAGIATRSSNSTYSIDMHANNSIAAADEAAEAPLDYDGSLVSGEIPSENYTAFSGSTSTSDPITIIDGTLPRGESGRVGSFSVAPAIQVSVPADTYGTFVGTLTFELSL